MSRTRKRRPSPALVVSLLALFVALGGSSYAVSRIGSEQIRNNSVRSVDLRNNHVRSTDVRDGSLRARDFRAGELVAGRQGPAGPQGPRGLRGLEGPAGPAELSVRWARVNGANGSVPEQSGGLSAERHATGIYSVDFGAPVTGKPYSAVLRGSQDSGEVAVQACPCSDGLPQDSNHVLIITRDSAGVLADRSIFVTLFG